MLCMFVHVFQKKNTYDYILVIFIELNIANAKFIWIVTVKCPNIFYASSNNVNFVPESAGP